MIREKYFSHRVKASCYKWGTKENEFLEIIDKILRLVA